MSETDEDTCTIQEIVTHIPPSAKTLHDTKYYVVATKNDYSMEPAEDLHAQVLDGVVDYWIKLRNQDEKLDFESDDAKSEDVPPSKVQRITREIYKTCHLMEHIKTHFNNSFSSDSGISKESPPSKTEPIKLDLSNNNSTTTLYDATTQPEDPSPEQPSILESFDLQEKLAELIKSAAEKPIAESKFEKSQTALPDINSAKSFTFSSPPQSGTSLSVPTTPSLVLQKPKAQNLPRFHCHICNKAFNRKHDLYRHERRHLGVKPYKCSVCGKNFSDSGNILKHIRNHHQNEPGAHYIVDGAILEIRSVFKIRLATPYRVFNDKKQ